MADPKPTDKNQAAEEQKAADKEKSAKKDGSHLKVVPPKSETLGKILDVPLNISVELGRTKILVQDLVELHKGSVVELNKLAGEPLELLVNNKVVAKGEVVVVNEKFGIRLTDIVSHNERIRQLGEKE